MRRYQMGGMIVLVVASVVAPGWAQGPAQVKLSEQQYRDMVYACWLGKSIGGTVVPPGWGREHRRRKAAAPPARLRSSPVFLRACMLRDRRQLCEAIS